MKDIIIDEAPHLSRDQHIEILSMVRAHPGVTEHNDGTRVNLDKLPAEIVNNIYR